MKPKFFILCAAIFALLPRAAIAAPPTMTVAPSIVRLDLAEDKPEAILRYANDSNQSVELSFSAKDVTYLEDGYKLSFLEKSDSRTFSYGLSSWISFDSSSLIVKPHETGQVTLLINKEKLSPGGHYGAVLATIQNGEAEGNVQLKGILSSLVFVRTATGNETEDAQAESLSCNETVFRMPDQCTLRFRNRGNVDLTPYGRIEVTGMFGTRVSRGIMNEASLSTLPESIRNYDIRLPKAGFSWPGRYRIELVGHYGKGDRSFIVSREFVSAGSAPLLWLSALVVLLISAVILLRHKHKR